MRFTHWLRTISNMRQSSAQRRRLVRFNGTALETLEVRSYPSTVSVAVDPQEQVIVITGTEKNDHVEVRADGQTVDVAVGEGAATTHFSFSQEAIRGLVFRGGDGQDSFRNWSPLPVIAFGGAGNDTLVGGDGNDLLWGDDGSDRLEGRLGLNELDGGAGTDSLSDQNRDVLRPTLLIVTHGFWTDRGNFEEAGNPDAQDNDLDSHWRDWRSYARSVASNLENAGSHTVTWLVDWDGNAGYEKAITELTGQINDFLRNATETCDSPASRR